jgi:hypothetical protein
LKSPRNGNRAVFAWRQSVLTELTAVQVTAILGFLWLLAYTFTGWAREASLALVWQVELWVADILGVAIRPSTAASGANEPLLWAAILGAYCLVSSWLVARAGSPLPSEEDLLDNDEGRAAGSPSPRGSR